MLFPLGFFQYGYINPGDVGKGSIWCVRLYYWDHNVKKTDFTIFDPTVWKDSISCPVSDPAAAPAQHQSCGIRATACTLMSRYKWDIFPHAVKVERRKKKMPDLHFGTVSALCPSWLELQGVGEVQERSLFLMPSCPSAEWRSGKEQRGRRDLY